MNRIPVTCAAVLAGTLAVALPEASAAPDFTHGRTVTTRTDRVKFPEPALHCLAMCVDVVVERREFECTAYIAPPITRCDLPWIDPDDPNPVPPGFEDQCIPEEGEVAGYAVLERAELVRRTVVQNYDCTTTVNETALQTLPPNGSNTRACPDPGLWVETSEVVKSRQFRPCP